MGAVTTTEHRKAAARIREVLSIYERNKDLITIGAYQKGSDPRVDYAIRMLDTVNAFLRQAVGEKVSMRATAEALSNMFTD
jgi:flagellum-specific ATP synthase